MTVLLFACWSSSVSRRLFLTRRCCFPGRFSWISMFGFRFQGRTAHSRWFGGFSFGRSFDRSSLQQLTVGIPSVISQVFPPPSQPRGVPRMFGLVCQRCRCSFWVPHDGLFSGHNHHFSSFIFMNHLRVSKQSILFINLWRFVFLRPGVFDKNWVWVCEKPIVYLMDIFPVSFIRNEVMHAIQTKTLKTGRVRLFEHQPSTDHFIQNLRCLFSEGTKILCVFLCVMAHGSRASHLSPEPRIFQNFESLIIVVVHTRRVSHRNSCLYHEIPWLIPIWIFPLSRWFSFFPSFLVFCHYCVCTDNGFEGTDRSFCRN